MTLLELIAFFVLCQYSLNMLLFSFEIIGELLLLKAVLWYFFISNLRKKILRGATVVCQLQH